MREGREDGLKKEVNYFLKLIALVSPRTCFGTFIRLNIVFIRLRLGLWFTKG